MTSQVRAGHFKITHSTLVERIEYIDRIPSVWPIPAVPTTYVLKLENIPKDDDGEPYKLDTLINKCVCLPVLVLILAYYIFRTTTRGVT